MEMNKNFENKQNIFFFWIEKKEIGRSWTMNEQNKKAERTYRVSHETWQYAGRLECRLDFWYNLLRLFVNLILEVNF